MSGFRERLASMRSVDPDEADKLNKLLERWEQLVAENAYGERFTERQFALVIEPLIASNEERVRVLELLSDGEASLQDLSEGLRQPPDRVFRHVKELVRRDLVRIVRFAEGLPILARTKK